MVANERVFLAKNIVTLESTVPAATAVAVENIDPAADADKNIVVIMKDGKIYNNTVQ